MLPRAVVGRGGQPTGMPFRLRVSSRSDCRKSPSSWPSRNPTTAAQEQIVALLMNQQLPPSWRAYETSLPELSAKRVLGGLTSVVRQFRAIGRGVSFASGPVAVRALFTPGRTLDWENVSSLRPVVAYPEQTVSEERAALPSAGQHHSHRDVSERAEQHYGAPQDDPHLATLPFLAYS